MDRFDWLELDSTPGFAAPNSRTQAAPIEPVTMPKDAPSFYRAARGMRESGHFKAATDFYRRAVGFARIANGQQEPTDDATRYRIGPASQLFTAALAMQLVEGASITLDSKLAEFYPDLPNALDITYRDLLQHRSGLADYTGVADFERWRTTPKTHAEILQIIAAAGAKFPPRERVASL